MDIAEHKTADHGKARPVVKVSVIVPVYNGERYIARCIESLQAQRLPECEFILVDDGSTDGSRAIIEQYRRRDARIKLLCQDNGGVSSARNAGLAAATGAYIGFVDADDYVLPDMFSTMYEAACLYGCDVVLSNFESELEGRLLVTSYELAPNVVLDRTGIREGVLPLLLRTETMNTACNKLYRAELIADSLARFPVGVSLGEDGWFNMLALGCAQFMVYIPYTGYCYCETEGSATRSAAGRDYFRRALEVFRSEPPELYKSLLSEEEIARLKSIKLIHSVLSYISVYMDPANGLPLGRRLAYVRTMIGNDDIKRALPAYMEENRDKLGRYHYTLITCMEGGSVWGLYLATAYSRMRNKRKRGNTA